VLSDAARWAECNAMVIQVLPEYIVVLLDGSEVMEQNSIIS